MVKLADKIIIELNDMLPQKLYGMHDIYLPLDPPYRREIPVFSPSDRAGSPLLKIDPKKVLGVVHTSSYDCVKPFTAPDEVSKQIGANVVRFLVSEYRSGRLPKEFLPLQSGVGNVANAVLYDLGESTELPSFMMYTEVIQDAVLELLRKGKCTFASTCSMTFTDDTEKELFSNMDFFRDKILMRPVEISNNPEVIRRLGVIAMNTALEADIFGNINSTHVLGTKMMNWHRRLWRLHPQRLSVDILLSVDHQGRPDKQYRAYGGSPRPQRAFGRHTRDRPGYSRPACQGSG